MTAPVMAPYQWDDDGWVSRMDDEALRALRRARLNRRLIKGWPMWALPLALQATAKGRATLPSNGEQVRSETKVVHANSEAILADAMPVAVRYALNYCAEKGTASQIMPLAVSMALDPETTAQRILKNNGMTPGMPTLVKFERPWRVK